MLVKEQWEKHTKKQKEGAIKVKTEINETGNKKTSINSHYKQKLVVLEDQKNGQIS